MNNLRSSNSTETDACERRVLTGAQQHLSATSLMVLAGSIAAILMYLVMLGSRAYLAKSEG